MYWYCHVMWRSVMKAALVPSNVKPFNHVTWHWTSDSYFICTCMFFVLSSILLVYICIYIYTLVQPMLYIYTSVERYYTHILYHFSHIYLCAFGHVDFTSQNTRLWNITQCNVLDYTMHDLPRPSHICFFSLQSDTAGYCAALYFGMQKYLILIHPIRARQWSSPLRSHEISCLVIWHDTTWHEMTWHSWWNLLQYQHNCRTFMPKVVAWPCLTYSGRRFLQFLMVMADHKFRTLLPKNFLRLDCIFSCWFCLDCWNFPCFFLMCQTLPDTSYLLHGLYGFSAFQQVMIFGYFGGGAPSVRKQIARRWDGRWEGVSWILRVLKY